MRDRGLGVPQLARRVGVAIERKQAAGVDRALREQKSIS